MRYFLGLMLLSLAIAGRAQDLLLVDVNARALAAELTVAGWIYGSNAQKKQIDCTQFIVQVVERVRKLSLDQNTRNRINITSVKAEQFPVLIPAHDAAITGLQGALIAAGHADAVAVGDIKSGDLLQYWYFHNGVWNGHASVIGTVTREGAKLQATLIGAHYNGGKNSFLGETTWALNLKDPERHYFAARLK